MTPFKKLISVMVVCCFVLSIINLPVYSAYNNIGTIGYSQSQEEYNLQAEFVTPAKAMQLAATNTASKETTTKTTTKKTTVSAKVKKLEKQNIKEANKLLKKKGLSKLAKTWLKKAKNLITGIKKGNKTNAQKETLLKQTLTSIKKVAKRKGSDLSLAQQTKGVFSSLKNVLKKNLTYKIYSKYTTKGITVSKALAKKFKSKLSTVYNQFVKYGVTKDHIKTAGNLLVKLVKRGVIFANCASLAVSKYLGISKNFAALQNLAAKISLDAKGFVNSYSNEKTIIGTAHNAQLKVLQKNGHKYADKVNISLKKLMSNLQPGEKAILTAYCYNKKGASVGTHAITIGKEKNGKYAVYDTLINGGNKIVYTAKEFKKFMNGKSAKGKTASGKSITKPLYYKNTTSGTLRYKFINNGEVHIMTDAKKMPGELRAKYNENIALVNNLLKKKDLSPLAKTWLTEAKNLLNKIFSSNKDFDDKKSLFNKTKTVLEEIERKNVSTQSLIKESSSKAIFGYTVFSSLNSVIKKDIAYKIYTKYDNAGIDVIETLSKKLNLSQTAIYNQFTKNNLTKNEMRILSYRKAEIENNNQEIYTLGRWENSYPNIGKSLVAIKNLAGK